MNALFIVNDPPYDTGLVYNTLRLVQVLVNKTRPQW